MVQANALVLNQGNGVWMLPSTPILLVTAKIRKPKLDSQIPLQLSSRCSHDAEHGNKEVEVSTCGLELLLRFYQDCQGQRSFCRACNVTLKHPSDQRQLLQ